MEYFLQYYNYKYQTKLLNINHKEKVTDHPYIMRRGIKFWKFTLNHKQYKKWI